MTEPLFLGFDPPDSPEALSAGRRLTLKQATLVKAGIHPLTRQRIHPEASPDRPAPGQGPGLYTCGTCVFRVLVSYHNRTYPKCEKHTELIAHSAASDVRAWWPACPEWEEC